MSHTQFVQGEPTGVVDGIEAVVENGSLDHFGGIDSLWRRRLRYLRVGCG
jgi:hypothetical protein